MSPFCIRSRNPDTRHISVSEIFPGNASEHHSAAPAGVMALTNFTVQCCLYSDQSARCAIFSDAVSVYISLQSMMHDRYFVLYILW